VKSYLKNIMGKLGTRNRVADEESREYKDWSEVTSRPPSPPGVR
jgi:hypothetical protein